MTEQTELNEHYKIKDLIKESSTTSSNQQAGRTLQAFTRATRSLIYEDLVAVQETQQPTASLYGARYLDSGGNPSFLSHATYSGAINKRTDIAEVTAKAYLPDELFKQGDIVYKVLAAVTFTNTDSDIHKALITKKIRYLSDAAETADLENADIAEVGVKIDRWDSEVKTRKLKTSFSLELMQDMEANQIVGKNVPFDLLSTIVSEDTNKDICQKLLHVSKVHTGKNITDGVFTATGIEEKDLARLAYKAIVSMGEQVRRDSSFAPTFVLASTAVVSLLKSSGWVVPSKDKPLSEGVTRCGLSVYADDTSPMDYAVVGFKHRLGELEYVSSLFYSPYSSTYSVVQDVQSFNDNIMIMNRYALSVNPYALDTQEDTGQIIEADQWDQLGGASLNSRCLMFDLSE